MKNIIIILALLPLSLLAQFEQDTTPQYDFMIVCDDSNEFNTYNDFIFEKVKYYNNTNGLTWCNRMQDTVTMQYGCEVPPIARLNSFTELNSVLYYIQEIQDNPDLLETNKAIILNAEISQMWKDIINNIQIVNRKKYKLQ